MVFRVAAWIERPQVAYPLLALLQLRVLWGDWRYRDLTMGDEVFYVDAALRWAQHGLVDLLWSPLYVVYFGSLLQITGEIAEAVWLHRTLMTFAATLAVFAVARALLPHPVAFLVAAWWAVLEGAFNVTVEVHLFGFLPLLLALVLVTRLPGRWGRASALAVLVAATPLVRNEYAVTAALVLAYCVWIERLGHDRIVARVAPYLTSFLPVAVAVAWFSSHADVPFPQVLSSADAEWKHTMNLCQVYAVSYTQRAADWDGNYWSACTDLMQRDFGAPLPTVAQAIRSNPTAMIEHFWWNLSLLPNGLQVALFNAMSGTVSPDYGPVPIDTVRVPWLSAGLAVLLVVGTVVQWLRARQRGDMTRSRTACVGETLTDESGGSCGSLPPPAPYMTHQSGQDRPALNLSPLLAVLVASVLTTLLVLVFERPRAEYIYSLTLAIMAAAGGSLALVVSLVPFRAVIAPILSVASVAVVAAVPGYYDEPTHIRPRQFFERYEILRPYAALLRDPERRILMADPVGAPWGYLGRDIPHYGGISGPELLAGYDGTRPLEAFLADRQITVVFAMGPALVRLEEIDGPLIRNPESVGWRELAHVDAPERRWVLLQRTVP